MRKECARRQPLPLAGFSLAVAFLANSPSAFSRGHEARTAADWRALQALAQELPEVNPDADPSYLGTVVTGQTLLEPLKTCSYDLDEMKFMGRLLQVIHDGQWKDGVEQPIEKQRQYILGMLRKMKELSFTERLQLEVGIRADISMTRAGITNENCRAYMKMHFENGLSRAELVELIRKQMK